MDAHELGRSWMRSIMRTSVYETLIELYPTMPQDSALRITHWILDMSAGEAAEQVKLAQRKQIKLRRARR